LSGGTDGGVGKKEDHGDQSTNTHSVFATKQLRVAHVACDNRTRNSTDIGKAVIAPRFEYGTVKDSAVVCKICTVNLVSKIALLAQDIPA
jgi:hypothetical protein